MAELIVIGGGLAGSEAAWQAAQRGVKVALFEMRPAKQTEAHKSGLLGELVCSNSLRSAELMSGPGLLKKELEMAGSLIMKAAQSARIPAGTAFAVNRTVFAEAITDSISKHALIRIVREEVAEVPTDPVIIATGPLTSGTMAAALGRVIGEEYLYFYDAIAPIVDGESISYEKVYYASRYGKGGDDYVNCPMTREEYESFYTALTDADRVSRRCFEDTRVFEGCMPIEVMAMRGKETLRFGPMKPVGLKAPKTGTVPYAVVQLRPENNEKTAFNMVGFQTRLTQPEQRRVFRKIPGLEHAEFLRYGSIHRNTFINAPLFLGWDLSLKTRKDLYFAGQITGVEGYIESTAMGLIAGINAARSIQGKAAIDVPGETAHGSLIRHITTPVKEFQPSNINFGLMPPLDTPREKKKLTKDMKKRLLVERALKKWEGYVESVG